MQNSPYSSICTATSRLQFPLSTYLNKIVWSIRVFSSLCCPHTSWSAQELTEQVMSWQSNIWVYIEIWQHPPQCPSTATNKALRSTPTQSVIFNFFQNLYISSRTNRGSSSGTSVTHWDFLDEGKEANQTCRVADFKAGSQTQRNYCIDKKPVSNRKWNKSCLRQLPE